MLTRPDGVSEMSYIYFPGVYAFWRGVMRNVGMTLPTLQDAYLAVIVTNAVLIGAIVLRVAWAPLAALIASLWYLVMCSRFEGFAGVTEPLATVPFLLGLFLWAGRPLRGRRALLIAALFGAALGLTVYTKQQGGLLTLGALGLLAARPAVPPKQRHGWGELAVVPCVAVAVLLFALLLEGRGWLPLQRGLGWAFGYAPEGSWLLNLYTQVRGDESAALAALIAVTVWGVMLSGSRRSTWAQKDAFQLVSFVIVAGLMTLIQFRTRPYGHYMLLGVPCIVLAVTLLSVMVLPHILNRFGGTYLARFLLLSAIAIPFVSTAGRVDTLYVWRVQSASNAAGRLPWHEQPSVQADLKQLEQIIPAGAVMYHFPPRHNSIYYLLGTYSASPYGYVYFTPDLESIAWEDCQYVVCLRDVLDDTDRQYWAALGPHEVERLLAQRGFRHVDDVSLETMELFRRNAAGGDQSQRLSPAPGVIRRSASDAGTAD